MITDFMTEDGALRFDANMLRNAAKILRRRSAKPHSLTLRVICRVLENAAADLDQRANTRTRADLAAKNPR